MLLFPVEDLDILQYSTFVSIPFIPPQCLHGNDNQELDCHGASQQLPSLYEWGMSAQGAPQNALL